MSIDEYYESFGAKHKNNKCNVCKGTTHSKPFTQRISFWAVIDTFLFIIAVISIYIYAIHEIQSIVR